jgi:hypothetical protein
MQLNTRSCRGKLGQNLLFFQLKLFQLYEPKSIASLSLAPRCTPPLELSYTKV